MRTLRGTAVPVVVFLCLVSAAAAQSRPGYPAVYVGAGVADPTSRQQLDLSMAATTVYDDNLLTDTGGFTPSLFQTSGVYTSLAPHVGWQLQGKRLQFNTNGASSFRYYPNLGQTIATNHNVGAGVSVQVAQKTKVRVNQTASYAPSYLYGLFAKPALETPVLGEPIAAAPDYQTSSIRSYTYGTSVTADHTVNARTSISFNGNVGYTDFVGQQVTANGVATSVRSSEGGGRLTYSLSQNVGLRLGYSYHQSRYSDSFKTGEHDLDVGVDYIRPLSPTRRSTVGFSIAPVLANVPSAAGASPGMDSHFRLTGGVNFDQQIGRSWDARAAYRRGLSYISILAGPLYTDSASVEATGFVNRRVDLLFSGAFATGQIAGGDPGAAPLKTYTADARARFALSRECAIYVEGMFYEYTFDPGLALVPGMPGHTRRSSVRAGIDLGHSMRSGNHATR